MRKIALVAAAAMYLLACVENNSKVPQAADDTLHHKKAVVKKPITEFEKECIAAGMVDVHQLDSTIVVSLKYSTTDNFMGMDMYGDFDKAYLQKDVAEKLVNAQKFLEEAKPGLHLIIYDAARQHRVQQLMWDSVKMPLNEKTWFLADPKLGSLHNFGAAVDISIVDVQGKALDMGTPFDFNGTTSATDNEAKLLNEGKLTQSQIDNRKLLRSVMNKAGFFNVQSEWWHFNACTYEEAMKKYEILE